MASFSWLGTLAGAAVLICNDSPRSDSSASLADCSELIGSFGEIRSDRHCFGSAPAAPHQHAESGYLQGRERRNDCLFIMAEDDGGDAWHLRGSPASTRQQQLHLSSCRHMIQPHELQKQPAMVHSLQVPVHQCIVPPVTPVQQQQQRFGSPWQSCGMLETSGAAQISSAAQQLPETRDGQECRHAVQVKPETQQDVKQEAKLIMAARRKVVRRPNHSCEASRQGDSSRSEDASASPAIAKPELPGLMIAADPVKMAFNAGKQPSSKKRLLDVKILELQLKGQPAAMSEKMIREELGNTPDTSKALRRLTQEGKLLRTGKGGRSSPFSYIATQEAQLALQQIKSEITFD